MPAPALTACAKSLQSPSPPLSIISCVVDSCFDIVFFGVILLPPLLLHLLLQSLPNFSGLLLSQHQQSCHTRLLGNFCISIGSNCSLASQCQDWWPCWMHCWAMAASTWGGSLLGNWTMAQAQQPCTLLGKLLYSWLGIANLLFL
jgi:hypothetical protein